MSTFTKTTGTTVLINCAIKSVVNMNFPSFVTFLYLMKLFEEPTINNIVKLIIATTPP
jgi:hypothetical protein